MGWSSQVETVTPREPEVKSSIDIEDSKKENNTIWILFRLNVDKELLC